MSQNKFKVRNLKYKVSTLLTFYFLFFASPVYADNPGPAGVLQLQQLIQRLINIIVAFAFMAAIAMVAWGGIKYITSGGDPKSVGPAKDIITWALVGLLFLVIAIVVLRIIAAFTGVNILQFCIGFPGAITGC